MRERTAYYCDALLIGFPNAGKSTLFNTLTGRQDSLKMPRFTKIHGVEPEIILADIGGISRGSTCGRINPGARWLAYGETCHTLVFVIALTARKLRSSRPLFDRCATEYDYLLQTVGSHRKDFLDHRRFIVLNRFQDIEENAVNTVFATFCSAYPETRVFVLNAADRGSVWELTEALKTAERCLAAEQQHGGALRYVPEALRERVKAEAGKTSGGGYTRKFVYTDEKTSKFWNIEVLGASYTVTYGKVGSSGQKAVKVFDQSEDCQKAALKVIKEKTGKGYMEQ